MGITRAKQTRKTKDASSQSNRSARLEARLPKSQKALIERAAAYEGRSVTDFIVGTLTSAAEGVIQRHEIIQLNEAQSLDFVQTLLNPPAPNAALRRAARRYRRTVESR